MTNNLVFLLTNVIATICLAVIALSILGVGAPNIQAPIGDSNVDLEAPTNILNESDISVLPDKVVMNLDSPEWATFTPTNSMAPTFNENAHAIQTTPKCPEEINIGDIISYTPSNNKDVTVIHRVVGIAQDETGPYFILQGDNNDMPDTDRVRCHQISRKTVAIIY